MTHQFSLFGYQRPSKKVPISAARIKAAKAEMAKGNVKGAVENMKAVRESLQEFERRLR